MDQDGKGPSIWDTFATVPGAIVDGSSQERAIDHYNRFRSDFELLAEIGPDVYRPSIAWSRIDPSGNGQWNHRALNYYSEVVDALLDKGIKPWVTLYHWDMPQAIQDRGGWVSRDTVARFRDFALRMQATLGDRVTRWTTFEEPTCVALQGYGAGRHAPGIADSSAALVAAHHVLLAHGETVRALKAANPDHELGIAHVLTPYEGASMSRGDLDAAARMDLVNNRMFLEPLLEGGYSPEVLKLIERYTDSGHIHSEDAAIIATPMDYLGINYYFRQYAKWTPDDPNENKGSIGCEDVTLVKAGRPQTLCGWEIEHDGLYDVLMRVHHKYPSMPLYVTEAGMSHWDEVHDDGEVHDAERIEYLREQFAATQRAIRAGVDLRGFNVWTFLDNWEWMMGWTQRFGLVHVDHDTLERRPKDSSRWYRNLIARQRDAEAATP